MTLSLTHDVSQDCAVYSSARLGGEVVRKLVQNAAQGGAKSVRIHYQELLHTVEITFSDDGNGMSQESLESIGWEARDRVSGGQEIRLVRQLIAEAGGTAIWQSRLGVGTWVTIQSGKVGAERTSTSPVSGDMGDPSESDRLIPGGMDVAT